MTLRRTALRKIGKRANWKKALDLLCKQVVFSARPLLPVVQAPRFRQRPLVPCPFPRLPLSRWDTAARFAAAPDATFVGISNP